MIKRLIVALFLIASVPVATLAYGVAPARAYDVGNALTTVRSGDNAWAFYNFDFHQVNSACSSAVVSSSNVDNPINLIWYQNASDAYVQHLLQNAGYGTNYASEVDCGAITQLSNDNTTYPQDQFMKNGAGCNDSNPVVDRHVRYYGTYYDAYWGFFVIAEAHKDINDKCLTGDPTQSFGYQEDAEHGVANDQNIYDDVCNQPPLYLGSECINATYPDSQNMLNQQEYTGSPQVACGSYSPYGFWIDNPHVHCMQSDGYATTFQVY